MFNQFYLYLIPTFAGSLTESGQTSYSTDYFNSPTSGALKIAGNNIVKSQYLGRYHVETLTFPADS